MYDFSSYGPRENPKISGDLITNGSLDCLVQYTPFARQPRINNPTTILDQERTLARQIESALIPCILLDRFPKSIIEVHILIIESDNNELCCSINGTTLALINTGIDMIDMAVATQCMALQTKDTNTPAQILLDPSQDEIVSSSSFRTIITMMPKNGLLTLTIQEGENNINNILNSLKVCMEGCLTMYQQMRNVLIEDGTKKAKRTFNRQKIKAESME